jgi:DNA repair protein RadC
MKLLDWPEDERPREKLALRGVEQLTDSELLAILIRTGLKGKSAVDVARELVTPGLGDVAKMSFEELAKQPGIGPARAAAIFAAFELGRRIARQPPQTIDFATPEAVYRHCGAQLNHLRRERFVALALNTKNRLIREENISEGDLNSSLVHPREVFEPLIRISTAAVIFVHNHPSGDPTPSQRDIEVTQRLRQVGELLGIKVLDHIVVGTMGFYSFQSHGFFSGSLSMVSEIQTPFPLGACAGQAPLPGGSEKAG